MKRCMQGVNPVNLSRCMMMDLPTVYASHNGAVVETGFGRYIRRFEKFLVLNKYSVASAVRTSVAEFPAKTFNKEW